VAGTGERGGGSSPAVVLVQLLSVGVVSLPLPALASGKLKPASRSGQKGSMANLQRHRDRLRDFIHCRLSDTTTTGP
jgi:hypothetical protein